MPETILINGDSASKSNGHSTNKNGIASNGKTTAAVKKEAQQLFVYEDAGHLNYLFEKLNTLRKNKQFCDVILQVRLACVRNYLGQFCF